ncbi:MAG: hypothetical protein GY841_08735, partial [FCB group bacterium]|nr:hypothetical protein [FCB group bacterium]
QRNLIIYLDGEQSLAVFVHNGYLEFFQQFVTQPKAAGEGQAGIANIDAIGEELTTFLDLYGAQDSTRLINSIFLCGKYGWGEDTAEFIGNRTGLPCIAAQAPDSPLLKYAGVERLELNDSIAAVITSTVATNRYPLAPDDFQVAVEKSSLIRNVSIAAAITLLFLGSWHYLQYRTETNINSQMLALQDEIRSFEQSPAYIAYVNLTHRLNRSKTYLEGIRNKRASHTHLLIKALSMNIPQQLSLTGFDLHLFEGRYTLQLDGNVRLKDFSPEIILAQYVEDLRKSPLFDNLIVTSHQKRLTNKEFELTFQLTLDARV